MLFFNCILQHKVILSSSVVATKSIKIQERTQTRKFALGTSHLGGDGVHLLELKMFQRVCFF